MTSAAPLDRQLSSPAKGVSRILAVKLADLGDALLSTPALRAVRAAYPEARIDVLTTRAGREVYARTGLVDRLHVFEKNRYDRIGGVLGQPVAPMRLGRALRGEAYHMVLLLHPLTTRYGALKHAALVASTGAAYRVGLRRGESWRGWFLTHWANDPGFDARHVAASGLAVAGAAGATPASLDLVFDPGESARAEAARALGRLGDMARRSDRRVVVVHPGTGPYSRARSWPAESFARVAARLADGGAQIVIVGRDGDPTAAVIQACASEVLDLSNRTSLPVLAAILERADLVICNDSGVMHLSTAMRTPVVAVFGPSNEVAWGPWEGDATGGADERHRVVRLPLPCRPCLYVGHALGSRHGCATRDCLRWLPPERVIEAARESLAASG